MAHLCVLNFFNNFCTFTGEAEVSSNSDVGDESVSCSCRILWYARMYAVARCESIRTRSAVITFLEKHFLTVLRKLSLPLLSFKGCRRSDSWHIPPRIQSPPQQTRSGILVFNPWIGSSPWPWVKASFLGPRSPWGWTWGTKDSCPSWPLPLNLFYHGLYMIYNLGWDQSILAPKEFAPTLLLFLPSLCWCLVSFR